MAEKWDARFLEMAAFVSKWSKDPSTKAGAIIVRADRTVLSLGFNGFPRGMDDNPQRYENREEKYSRIIHCEINALIHARQAVPEGCTLYTWPFASCDRCIVQMLQAGIRRFVFPTATETKNARWGNAFEATKKYMEELGAVFVEVSQKEIQHDDLCVSCRSEVKESE